MENYFGKLGTTQEEALKKVTPIIEGILKAQDDVNYDDFCSFFEDALKEKITPEMFVTNQQNMIANMGKIADTEFVTSLKRAGMIGLVYKAKFTNNEDDFVITITINDETEPLKATGIWIS